MQWKIYALAAALILTNTACTAVIQAPTPTATLTATPTATATQTSTATPTASDTPPPTASATATLTPTITDTPTVTFTPSPSPIPTSTPGRVIGFTLDNWQLIELPDILRTGLPQPYVALLTLNDRDDVGSAALTPQPGTGVQTLYFSPPQNRAGRIPILQIPESTGDRVFPSPAGNGVTYFIDSGEATPSGLYMLDMSTGVSARILPLEGFVQRGFSSPPTWAPDGSVMAITLATAYATDIFFIERAGTAPQNITNSGSYDVFPAFSPDGRYLAFVSDRAICPTWIPEQPDTCDNTDTSPPNGGHLYVLERATGEITRLSETWLTEPPKWINNTQIAYAEGDPLFGDSERVLWLADAITGSSREIRPSGVANPLMLAESWSPDGTQIVYQSAGAETEIVLVDVNGNILATNDTLNYPRFGMQASWAPDSTRIAIGGVSGQCPFGTTVLDTNFTFIARSAPPPSMCAPAFSPDGAYIAYTGVSLNNFDGRSDIYVANGNGFGSANLTGDLRGTMTFLGWVGGTNTE